MSVFILIDKERGFDIFLTIQTKKTMISLRVKEEVRFVKIARLSE